MATGKVPEFIDKFKEDAEVLVTKVFPGKVVELEAVYQKLLAEKNRGLEVEQFPQFDVPTPIVSKPALRSPALRSRRVNTRGSQKQSQSGSPTGNARTALVPFSDSDAKPTTVIPTNTYIQEWIDEIKPLVIDLMEHTNQVKMWISFLIPKWEDGNNFGVSVQFVTLEGVLEVEELSRTYLEDLSEYYETRGKLISRILKHPGVEDYQQALRELDQKQALSLRLMLCGMRNSYATLHHNLQNNMEKIKTPRSNAGRQAMY